MNIEIRLAAEQDIDALEKLYDETNDYLAGGVNYPGWKKGVYPTREDAVAGVAGVCLYVAVCGSEIVGSIVLLHEPEPAYLAVKWQLDLDYANVLIIHTFVVSPRFAGQGIGRLLLEFAADHGTKQAIKALRLDVYEKNLPAMSLYEKCGFKYIDTVDLGLSEFGLEWFKLYEKLL